MGEPAGIGPDITALAWLNRAAGLPPFVYVGCARILADRAARLGLDIAIEEISEPSQAPSVFTHALPVLPLVCAPSEPGKPSAATAGAVIEAIETSVRLAQAGEVAGVVTNPIAKSVLTRAGFAHRGHTEFLAELARRPPGRKPPPNAVMMLVSEELKVVPATCHIPLAEVSHALTTDLVFETGSIVARELTQRFGLAEPRLAISGLNPHAGEDGTMGREDADIITPAIGKLRDAGIDASGPWPADTMFHATARARYDAAICMYHDQALIPIKTLAFDRAVNVTLGLDFIRTSPDHGTAFDIAGSGAARATSLIEALKLAGYLARGTS
ncbi:4-hydroxythreonine-4-phosphate dehydrogenase [hydrothermal vent metagenome]|uniref:4-hydroxythreonine-4-phosphate dehydrogenase n=1 Tax=hydrothermal vent metagenome TaxID=652676 RepID=A0A3B0T240_9ZZZZ